MSLFNTVQALCLLFRRLSFLGPTKLAPCLSLADHAVPARLLLLCSWRRPALPYLALVAGSAFPLRSAQTCLVCFALILFAWLPPAGVPEEVASKAAEAMGLERAAVDEVRRLPRRSLARAPLSLGPELTP